jgi:hypothetical protein
MNEFDRMALERSRMDWVMPGVLLLVGLPCMLIALYMAGDEFLFRRTALQVQGVVLDRGEGTPTLTVEYSAPSGARHQIESFGSDLYEDVKVGDKVGVFMKASNPELGRLDFFTAGWMLPMILGIFGSFFGIPGMLLLRGAMRSSAGSRAWKGAPLPVQGKVIEIQPVMTMDGFRKRRMKEGPFECSLSKEAGQWVFTVNGEPQDPFAAHANREWGVQYCVVAEWHDQQTGKTHTCYSDPVDIEPGFYLQFGTVTVLVDSSNAENCKIDMSFLPVNLATMTA